MLSCDGIFCKVMVLVEEIKGAKTLKVKGKAPLLWVYKGFVVFVWWGCEGVLWGEINNLLYLRPIGMVY